MDPVYAVPEELAGRTVAACLRHWLPGQSWSQIHKLIAGRRVCLNGELWLDPARRVRPGDAITVRTRPLTPPRLEDNIVIRHIDEDILVVEKPAGISTVRHPAERQWSEERRQLVPTLDDLVLRQIGMVPWRSGPRPRLRIVHRLDKETSGLVVFARTVTAERGLGLQFKKHTVLRRYLAVVPGILKPQSLHSFLVRDRGDGRRGSSPVRGMGKEAITHVEVEEHLPGYTVVSCRLETGRTHQIRIHLAEIGHPVCGEKVYNRPLQGEPQPDPSRAPRLALHAVELGFVHPRTQEPLQWSMPLPPDLRNWLENLRAKKQRDSEPRT